MSKNVRTEAVDHLFDAILSLENKEECYKFFEGKWKDFIIKSIHIK